MFYSKSTLWPAPPKTAVWPICPLQQTPTHLTFCRHPHSLTLSLFVSFSLITTISSSCFDSLARLCQTLDLRLHETAICANANKTHHPKSRNKTSRTLSLIISQKPEDFWKWVVIDFHNKSLPSSFHQRTNQECHNLLLENKKT